MDTERRSITRPDGRNIDFLVDGPADGLPSSAQRPAVRPR